MLPEMKTMFPLALLMILLAEVKGQLVKTNLDLLSQHGNSGGNHSEVDDVDITGRIDYTK